MMNRISLLTVTVSLSVAWGSLTGDESKEEKPAEKAKLSFEKDIKPIFEERCVHCHNLKTLPEHVSFENAKLAMSPSPEGKVYIVPGKPDDSLLVTRIEAPLFHEKLMPQVGDRLTDEEKKRVRRWIAEGADWPKGKEGKVRVTFRALE